MNLLDVARGDLPSLLSDFSVAASITSPLGVITTVEALHRDTGEMIDPETGLNVSGRHVSIAVAISSLPSGLPYGVPDRNRKPWKVEMEGKTFRVVQTRPDTVLGVLVMILEVLA